jgi:hypothetical protein
VPLQLAGLTRSDVPSTCLARLGCLFHVENVRAEADVWSIDMEKEHHSLRSHARSARAGSAWRDVSSSEETTRLEWLSCVFPFPDTDEARVKKLRGLNGSRVEQ